MRGFHASSRLIGKKTAITVAAAAITFHLVLLPACEPSRREAETPRTSSAQERPVKEDAYSRLRQDMVDHQLRPRGITNAEVLAVMGRVPRHEFVPENIRHYAYSDGALPIGLDQTISQPYIVALMTQLAQPKPGARVLDVGTGSGYQAAVLAELVGQVYGIEIICALADQARQRLQRLGYDNVEVRCGDGYRGWPEHAPFDLIILAAAPSHVPQPLVDQLAPGGRLVLPVGETYQELVVIEKQDDGGTKEWSVIPVRFVPMTGEAEEKVR